MCINLDVAKVDLDVSLLQTSSFNVVDACCWVLQTLNFNVADLSFGCCRHVMFGCRGGGGAPGFDDVAQLQHFVSCISSTLTCCDICILMFHCDLANVADVEFRCCRHVMGVVSRRGGRAPDVGCCMQHKSQHSRNMVAACGGGGRKTPDVGCCT
jgi:hypothetical protein